MMKLPAKQTGQWTVQQESLKLPDIVATRNLTFDKEGYVRLSKPTISFGSVDDDADFDLPIGIYSRTGSDSRYLHVLTLDNQFTLDMEDGKMTLAEDTSANVPDGANSNKAGCTDFNSTVAYAENNDIHTLDFSNGSWTDQAVTPGDGRHVLVNFASRNTIAVSYQNTVLQYNTSWASGGSTLIVPDGQYIIAGAYNRGYTAWATSDNCYQQGYLFIWDGATAAANFAYPLGAPTGYIVMPYKNTFVVLTSNGQLLQWTGSGLDVLANLPAYFQPSIMSVSRTTGVAREISWKLDGDIILFNIRSYIASNGTNDGFSYIQEMPGGIWCYDPAVGLYHRHATTATKVVLDTIATASVDTTNNKIAVAAAPDTGTPVRYAAANGTALAPLTNGTVYYTIKVDATNVKLATTYSNALAGTAIDLTGTGNNAQTLQFYKKPDFGQSLSESDQGVVSKILDPSDTPRGVFIMDYLYGASVAKTGTTEKECGGFVMTSTENRGYFVTSVFQSPNMQEDWQKLYIKHSRLVNDLDKIVVKYRTQIDKPIVNYEYANTTATSDITWSDADTFTSTSTLFANVIAGDEVEVIQGAGAGYLLHILSITESSGTYTVNLTESVKNIAASDTGRVVVSRWTHLKTLDTTTPQNNDGYSELLIAKRSKNIQFKIELRGEDIEIEELLVAHAPVKLAI